MVGGHANGGMMSLARVMFVISTVILAVTGNPVHSSKNVTTSNTSEPLYKCACDPPDCNNGKYCDTPGKCYVFEKNGEIRRNCFRSVEQSNMNCHSKAGVGHFTCCEGNMCNQNLSANPLPRTAVETEDLSFTLKFIIAASCVLSTCVFIMVVIYLIRRHIQKRRAESLLLAAEARLLEDDSLYKGFQDSTKHQDHWSSGSGSGQPTLVRRTVGKQVTLIERIGKGRFGEVWRGRYLGSDVAVKIFSTLEESSWNQETEMYNTLMLRHKNILGYCASDTVGILSCTQNLLILDYHPNGSLYDYLQRSDIDMEEMLILAHSAAAGLVHLHDEIKEGTHKNEKPAIAHRDIKSKNILVRDDGQCCIGDLGHAVRNDRVETVMEPGKLLVGTKRYMAPEVLTETLNPAFFESFKCVDVYAFGLVLWEIAKRARPFTEEYRVPFWDVVPADPSFEDMKRVVAIENQRPPIPNKWSKEPLMCEMAKLMSECWAQNPKVRLTILRVKKNLHSLLKMSCSGHSEKMEKFSPKIVDSSSSGNSSGNFSGRL